MQKHYATGALWPPKLGALIHYSKNYAGVNFLHVLGSLQTVARVFDHLEIPGPPKERT